MLLGKLPQCFILKSKYDTYTFFRLCNLLSGNFQVFIVLKKVKMVYFSIFIFPIPYIMSGTKQSLSGA